MSDRFLICPACGHADPAETDADCPDCGSGRTFLHYEPAVPDAGSEAYVKLDAAAAAELEREA